LINYHKFIHNY